MSLLLKLMNASRAGKGLPPLLSPPEEHGCRLPPVPHDPTNPPVWICGTPFLTDRLRRGAIEGRGRAAMQTVQCGELSLDDDLYQFGYRSGVVDFIDPPDEIRNDDVKLMTWCAGWLKGEAERLKMRQEQAKLS